MGITMPPEATAQVKPTVRPPAYRIFERSGWVDSLMSRMSLEQKIGQLFMVSAFTTRDKYNIHDVSELVQKYHIGGVIFFRGGPMRTALAINRLQTKAEIPLLMSIDGEWGLAMRLDSTINYGYQMPLGAISDDSFSYRMGAQIARECRRIGFQVNFAPVVDINNNPLNPVINLRSFGENKQDVTRRGLMYMRGMQDQHVVAVAKHFPGHGNTSVDSHYDLPVIHNSRSSMDSLELFPFKALFSEGVGGVMTAHLNIPAYDTTSNTAASISPAISTGLLRWQLGYKGLAITDALNMKGVSKFTRPGELEYKALLAGNDILLCPDNVPKAFEMIRDAIDSGCISMDFLNQRVRAILEVKKWSGLDRCQYVDTTNLLRDLNRSPARLLKQNFAARAVTVVRNTANLIPVRRMDNLKLATVAFGAKGMTAFQEQIGLYSRADNFQINMFGRDAEFDTLEQNLKSYSLVIASLHYLSNRTNSYGISDKTLNMLQSLAKQKRLILVDFGTPYAMSRVPDCEELICAWQDDPAFQHAAADIIFGSNNASGHLPVNASASYPISSGLITETTGRIQYTYPEAIGLDSRRLGEIDSIAIRAIHDEATPGCQVMAIKDSKVLYFKAFGKQTYSGKTPLQTDDVFDLASVTKVAATTLCVMKLYDEGRISPENFLGDFLPELKGTNKEKLTIQEVMTHQAGLIAWIPFYKATVRDIKRRDSFYCDQKDSQYTVRVATKMYLRSDYPDTMRRIMDRSALEERGRYKYSDLGFMYMQRVVEKITGRHINILADSLFYRPLGLRTMGYLPLNNPQILPEQIVPTELDTVFRKQLLKGDVHDPAAAMLGGVSGHAGLFSDASDLGVLMQMLLNKGSYAGRQYLKPETVALFTQPSLTGNRRGLGWDKPEPSFRTGPTSLYASPMTFGHTGFTGTCCWVDPQSHLVYVFLSNRVHPSAENHKLVDTNVRTRIMDVIYRAILGKKLP